ncbi:MAG TPA: sulfite reductase subunit alpha [Verrucomicrobiae bacterium]|nr:sulfite reductase subunit alpha [Verrucomicrobiae bacterium]
MNKLPYIPGSAPFTPEQRAWLNGYLAGLFADANVGEVAAPPRSASEEKRTEALLVMYGSQSGNAEQLARHLAKEAEKRRFAPRVMEMNAFASVDFANEQRFVIVTSTWGDGDPPENAAAFWQHLNSHAAPRLDHLSYSVLALGDKNYSDFCGAGKKFDERLEQLGARRIHPRADCDVDYETTAKQWMEGLWSALEKVGQASRLSPIEKESAETAGPGFSELLLSTGSESGKMSDPRHGLNHQTPTICNRNNPFPARLIVNRKLNSAGSAKDTRHLEISLDRSGLNYEVGDALGVMPVNCPALVNDLLQALGCDGEEAVSDARGRETSLRQALLTSYQITQPSTDLLRLLSERPGDAKLKSLLDPARRAALDKFLDGREVIDFLLNFPSIKFTPADFVALLSRLQPRLYSIASSLKAHPGEVHLTVAVVRYERHGRRRQGVCSTFLAERVEINQTPLPVFVQPSHGFRLPSHGNRPVIMIGPGTGIAPFRAFLEERRAIGANGRNWLFFGDQCQAHDFLYREELEAMLAGGTLTRLDTAFSRDQNEKIYVQHRMLENAGGFWTWLEEGAHVYVCGDAKRMAKDVDAALHEVIRKAGGKSAEQAAEYVQKLRTEKRYQRDVY